MPLTSIYDIGTVTLTSGSPTVTGNSTNWVGAGLREGDLLWADGLMVRVLALVSNTELTLAHPWPGTSRTGWAYEIHYTSDASRVLAKTSELLAILDGGASGALKDLVPAADRLPYFNSASTAALTVLTAFGRDLIDSPDAAAALTTLDILLQGSRYDTTSNRYLRTGAFGLGAVSTTDITNIDDVNLPACICSASKSTVAGTVPASSTGNRGVVLVLPLNNTHVWQLWFTNSTPGQIWVRKSSAGAVWEDWRELTLI